jgi:tetratricopeptide (TPR) repeat protein
MMRGAEQKAVVAALLVLAWPAAAVASPATPAMIAEVQTALDRGDALHAANLAESAIREPDISPGERARLTLYHGLAEELLGVRETATRDFTAALDSRALPPEERAQALLQRGFLRDGEGKLNEAIADYSAVIALHGEGLATALNNRANVYRRQNKLNEAKRDYQAAFGAGSKGQYVWYGLGQIAEAQKDVATARDYYARAVIVDPNYALASERLAALGGPPDTVVASSQAPILLKPPAPSPLSAKTAQPAGADSPQISLRPALDQSAKRPAVDQAAKPPSPEAVKGPLVDQAARPSPPAQPARQAAAADQASKQPVPVQSAKLPVPDQPAKGEVQLGAFRSEAEAKAGWAKALGQARDLLAGHEPHIVAADLPGKGRYYRLRISAASGVSQREFCDRLSAKGLGCFPVRD